MMMDLIRPLGICGSISEIQAQQQRVELSGTVLASYAQGVGFSLRRASETLCVSASGASTRVEWPDSTACRQTALSAF